jgi:uncharacterized protein YegL
MKQRKEKMNTVATPTLEEIELADNPDPRCACVLLLDTSGSTAGPPIDAINKGLRQVKAELQQDSLASKRVEFAVIGFGSEITVHQDFVTVDAFEPPTLLADGPTPMGAAVCKSLEIIEQRKAEYRKAGVSYYRPWVFLISDGAPTDDTIVAERRVREAEANKKIAFFAVGVDGADMQQLAKFSVRPPLKLDGLNFSSLFSWLSASLQNVASSRPDEQVALPAAGWAKV